MNYSDISGAIVENIKTMNEQGRSKDYQIGVLMGMMIQVVTENVPARDQQRFLNQFKKVVLA